MQRDTVKRFYEIHSWVGALTAILIFVICYTGAVSVFGRPEIKIWANETIRGPVDIDPIRLERLVKSQAESVPEAYLDHITVTFPGVRRAEYLSIRFEQEVELEDGTHQHSVMRFDYDPSTLALHQRLEGTQQELFKRDKVDIADFIIQFHADLHLGSPWGLWLTGLLGLTLFASIVTGIIVHRKILKEMFTFRPWRSFRLLLTDSHKVLGVWGTLFHITIAFTGAFLGLAVVALLPAAAFVSFGGDQEKLVDTFLPEPFVELSHQPAEIRFANILHAAKERGEGSITAINIYSGKDKNALVVVNTLAGKENMVGKTLSYRAETGELISNTSTFDPVGGLSGKLFDLMFPLHFGNFGGLPIKFLWSILGLSTAMLGLTGMMIWLERRTQSSIGKLTPSSYRKISVFSAGSCIGLMMAVAVIFPLQLFLDHPGINLGFWISVAFFATWFSVTASAFLFPSNYLAIKWLLFAAGGLHFVIPFINGMMTGDHIVHALLTDKWVTAGVDIVLLLYGLFLMWLARRLPESRLSEVSENAKSHEVFNVEPKGVIE